MYEFSRPATTYGWVVAPQSNVRNSNTFVSRVRRSYTFEWQNGFLQHWKFDPATPELSMRFQFEAFGRTRARQADVIASA
jgi:hypothetical protein